MRKPLTVTVIDKTNGSDFWGDPTSKVFIIRDSGTFYRLLSFDYLLEAWDAALRYGQPLEINWATEIQPHDE